MQPANSPSLAKILITIMNSTFQLFFSIPNLGIEVTDSWCKRLRNARRAAEGECGID